MASKREALIASAEKLLAKGKVDAALKEYLKVLEETPGDINVLNKVGDLFVRLNRNEDSIPYFTRIAEHYAKDGFFLKSIAIWKKVNKLDPSRLEVYEKLAELYSKQGLGMEARSQYQVLADYYSKQDNLPGAIGIYQKMSAAEPANIQLHVRLADLYTQAKRTPDALKEYAVVGGSLRDRGALDEAIQVYEKALKLAPDNLDILKVSVPLLVDKGRVEEGRVLLRKALETTPRSVPIFLMAAEAAYVANDMADARSLMAKAQSIEPTNEEVLSLLVKIQLKGRRPDLAFQAAVPLVDAALRRGEAKKAFTILIPVAKAASDTEDILRKTVEVATSAGDEVGSVPFRSALADIYRKRGKVQEAAEQLRACLRAMPEEVEFRARLGQLEPLLPRPTEMPSKREITLSGHERIPAVRPAPAPAPAPSSLSSNEFEFSLDDAELVEEAVEEVEDAPARPVPPPTTAVPRFVRDPERPPVDVTRPGSRQPPPPSAFPQPPGVAERSDAEMAYYGGSPSASDAMAEYEARIRSGEIPPPPAPTPIGATLEPSVDATLPVSTARPEIPPPPPAAPPATSISLEAQAVSLEEELAVGFSPAPLPLDAPSISLDSLSFEAFEAPAGPEPAPPPPPAVERPAPVREVAPPAPEAMGQPLRGFPRPLPAPVPRPAPQAAPPPQAPPAPPAAAPAPRPVVPPAPPAPAAAAPAQASPPPAPPAPAAPVPPAPVPPAPAMAPEPVAAAPVAAPQPREEAPAEPPRAPAPAVSAAPAPPPAKPPVVAAPPVAPAPVAPAPVARPVVPAGIPEPPVAPIVVPAAVVTAAPRGAGIAADAADADVEEALLEADVFRKYGLLDKAAEQLRNALKNRETSLRLREKLFEIYLEQGKMTLARREAEWLKEQYAAQGREDRVRALAVLLGEPLPPKPASAAGVPAVFKAPIGAGGAADAAAEPPSGRRREPAAPEVALPGPRPAPAGVKAPGGARQTADADALLADLQAPKREKPRAPAATGKPVVELPSDLLGKPEPKPARPAAPARPSVTLGALADLEAGLKKPAPRDREPVPSKPSVDVLASLAAEAGVAGPRREKPARSIPGSPEAAEAQEGSPAAPPPPVTLGPSGDELAQLDFWLDQGMVVDAAERLHALEERFPADAQLAQRRQRLEGAARPSEEARPGLQELLTEDLEQVLDAELGKALTDEMARGARPTGQRSAEPAMQPPVDESGLFSDEQEFFNFAGELQAEMKRDVLPAQPDMEGKEVSLEEIFREFKKGVEQQLSPEDYETHYNLGIAYKEMGLTDEAIGEFQLASKDPLHAVECCSMLGLCFLEKGLPQLAIKWYRKGLESIGIREDDRLGLQYDLAKVYMDVGDRENAYKTFLEIYGSNAHYRDVGDRLKELAPA